MEHQRLCRKCKKPLERKDGLNDYLWSILKFCSTTCQQRFNVGNYKKRLKERKNK